MVNRDIKIGYGFMVKDSFTTQLSYPVLLQYITQKICHDLATPVGAIRLGLEHLEHNELTPILMQSIDNATTRIDVFRQFFSNSTDTIESVRVGKLVQAYLKSKNVEFESTGSSQGTRARLMLGLGVVACEALPRGGKVIIDFDNMTLECEGPIIHMPYTHFDIASLLKEDLNFKSGIILFHVLFLAKNEKLTLGCTHESNALVLAFTGQNVA